MPKSNLSTRQKQILTALQALGGTATTQQLADKLREQTLKVWHINGLSQSGGPLDEKGRVKYTQPTKKAREDIWELI